MRDLIAINWIALLVCACATTTESAALVVSPAMAKRDFVELGKRK